MQMIKNWEKRLARIKHQGSQIKQILAYPEYLVLQPEEHLVVVVHTVTAMYQAMHNHTDDQSLDNRQNVIFFHA